MASNRRDLKSYVRYDGSGRIIPGSNVLRKNMPKVGKWKETQAYQCCNPTPPPIINALRLTFDSIENADLLVGDSSDVNDWNTFFDLPTYGNPFTSVEVVGDEVQLFGGSDIIAKQSLFYPIEHVISVNDLAGSIIKCEDSAFGANSEEFVSVLEYVNLLACTSLGTEIEDITSVFSYNINLQECNFPSVLTAGDYCFYNCTSLTTISLPLLTSAGDYCFYNCTSLTTIDLQLLTTAGSACFFSCTSLTTIDLQLLTTAGSACFYDCYSLTTINLPSCTDLGLTSGVDFVFDGISSNTITATFNSVLATNNGGNPDGDIQYLSANNTVTITYV